MSSWNTSGTRGRIRNASAGRTEAAPYRIVAPIADPAIHAASGRPAPLDLPTTIGNSKKSGMIGQTIASAKDQIAVRMWAAGLPQNAAQRSNASWALVSVRSIGLSRYGIVPRVTQLARVI